MGRRIETVFKPAAQQPGSLIVSPQARSKRKQSEEDARMVDGNKQQRLVSERSSSSPGRRSSGPELLEVARCEAKCLWACSRCTFANAPELPYCEMCEAERIDSQCEATSSSSSSMNKSSYIFP